jgi:spore germination protein GerM
MLGPSVKRLGLLIGIMLALYLVFTSPAVHSLADSAGALVRGWLGRAPAPVVVKPPTQPDPVAPGPSTPTAIVYHAAEAGTPAGKTRFVLYFADSDAMFLVPVTRTVNLTRTPIKDALSELIRGPAAGANLASPFIEMAVRDLALRADGTLRIDIPTQVVQASTGWGSTGSLLALESMVNTVSEFSAVRRVAFLVGGKATSTLFHGLSAAEPIPAQKWQSAGGRVTLYFAVYAGNRAYLIPEQIDVAQADVSAQMRQAVEQLRVGRSVGDFRLHPTLPANVSLLGVTVANQVATLNLSSEFNQVFELPPARQALIVDSLVFTLTSFANVNRVQLLVEGQKVQRTVGKHNLANPLQRPQWINPE